LLAAFRSDENQPDEAGAVVVGVVDVVGVVAVGEELPVPRIDERDEVPNQSPNSDEVSIFFY